MPDGSSALRDAARVVVYKGRSAAIRAGRRVRYAYRVARHLAAYRVPHERDTCPACGGRPLRHLAPLSSSRPLWRFGFISGCVRCGVLFANPLPSEGDLIEAYSPEGEWGRHRQEEQEKPVSQARLEAIFAPVRSEFDITHPRRGASVLDLGCGLGGLLDSLAALGWDTHGIDPATKVAFQRHRELASIPDHPQFDLVVLHHVIEHVTDPLAILRQLARATRDGGFLFLSVPNLDDVAEHGELKYCLRHKVHVLAYSAQCLEWLAAAAGFRIVSTSPIPRKPRQRVALARRESSRPLPSPARPLESARAALDRYYNRHPDDRGPLWASLPVRLRAAYWDLERARWRIAEKKRGDGRPSTRR